MPGWTRKPVDWLVHQVAVREKREGTPGSPHTADRGGQRSEPTLAVRMQLKDALETIRLVRAVRKHVHLAPTGVPRLIES